MRGHQIYVYMSLGLPLWLCTSDNPASSLYLIVLLLHTVVIHAAHHTTAACGLTRLSRLNGVCCHRLGQELSVSCSPMLCILPSLQSNGHSEQHCMKAMYTRHTTHTSSSTLPYSTVLNVYTSRLRVSALVVYTWYNPSSSSYLSVHHDHVQLVLLTTQLNAACGLTHI